MFNAVFFLQPGSANLRAFAALLVPTDMDHIREHRNVVRLTGTHVRNQAYYDLAQASGVLGAGNNVHAPPYVIAAVEAAVPWGKGGIAGLIPIAHCDRLESSPPILQDDIDAALEVIIAMGASEAPTEDLIAAPN
jgi:hypothetical protein